MFSTCIADKSQDVHQIYKRNHWPRSNYDREQCRIGLVEWEEQKSKAERVLGEAAAKKNREKFLSRLSPEELRRIQEKRKGKE